MVIALPVYFSLPSGLNSRFNLRLDYIETLGEGHIAEYHDLNGDGNTERLLRQINRNQSVSLVVYDIERVIGQWNFPGSFPLTFENLFVGDLNGNGLMEIYLFVILDETLWIHIIEPFADSSEQLRSYYVDTINPRDGLIEAWVLGGTFADINADGYTDFVFAVNATYSAYPRRIYILDGETGELHRSKHLGVGIRYFHLFDLNNDGKLEIIIENSSYANTKSDTLRYDDHHCWLMVLTHDLEFYFEPIQLAGVYHYLDLVPFVADDTLLVGLTFGVNAPVTNSQLLVFDKELNKLIEKSFGGEDQKFSKVFKSKYKGKESLFLVESARYEIYRLDDGFTPKKKVGEGILPDNPAKLDLNGNGNSELVLIGMGNSTLRVYGNDFANVAQIETGQFLGEFPRFSVKKITDAEPALVLSGDRKVFHFLYSQNLWYHYRYPVYLIVYLLSFGFILLIQRIGQKQLKRRMAIERQLSTLQINNVLTQLDPHFTFNILNSVSAFVMREEKQKAYDQLRNFSRLIRSSLIDAEKVYRTIEDELEAIRNYLDLQAQSYPDRFDYQIIVDESVDTDWSIPKMMLHTFADNALKHGSIPAPYKGKLMISVNADDHFIKLIIEDNGVGRKAAAKQNKRSTRKGIALFRQFADFYNRYNKEKMHFDIVDLFNELGEPAGTRVEIAVPIGYDFSGIG